MSDENFEQTILLELMAVKGDLHHFIFASIPNWSDADDVLQEVCLKVWKSKEQFEIGTSFRAWAFTITRYTIMDFRKRYATRKISYLDAESLQILADEMVAGESVKNDVYVESLAACLRHLETELTQLLKMHYRDGFSMAELAEREGGSATSMKQRLYRARLKLRECMELKISKNQERLN